MENLERPVRTRTMYNVYVLYVVCVDNLINLIFEQMRNPEIYTHIHSNTVARKLAITSPCDVVKLLFVHLLVRELIKLCAEKSAQRLILNS